MCVNEHVDTGVDSLFICIVDIMHCVLLSFSVARSVGRI